MTEPLSVGDEFLTVPEIAARLRVSKMTVYRIIQDGALTASRFGGVALHIHRDDLETYIADSRLRP